MGPFVVCWRSVADKPVDDAADDGEDEGGKGGCPEAADGHARHDEGGDLEHEAVDHEGEEAEGEQVDRQCEQGDDRFDDGVNDGEHDGAEHEGGKGVEVEALHELSGEIEPEAIAQEVDDERFHRINSFQEVIVFVSDVPEDPGGFSGRCGWFRRGHG